MPPARDDRRERNEDINLNRVSWSPTLPCVASVEPVNDFLLLTSHLSWSGKAIDNDLDSFSDCMHTSQALSRAGVVGSRPDAKVSPVSTLLGAQLRRLFLSCSRVGRSLAAQGLPSSMDGAIAAATGLLFRLCPRVWHSKSRG